MKILREKKNYNFMSEMHSQRPSASFLSRVVATIERFHLIIRLIILTLIKSKRSLVRMKVLISVKS